MLGEDVVVDLMIYGGQNESREPSTKCQDITNQVEQPTKIRMHDFSVPPIHVVEAT